MAKGMEGVLADVDAREYVLLDLTFEGFGGSRDHRLGSPGLLVREQVAQFLAERAEQDLAEPVIVRQPHPRLQAR